MPNPDLSPEIKNLFDLSLPVAPLKDLLIPKLNSFGPKDLVHLQILDEVGFITQDVEQSLPEPIRERLWQARSQFGENLDVEE